MSTKSTVKFPKTIWLAEVVGSRVSWAWFKSGPKPYRDCVQMVKYVRADKKEGKLK